MWHPRKAVNIISLIVIAIFLAITVLVVQYTIFSKQEADEKNLITFTASSPAVLKDKDLYIEVAVEKPDSPVKGVYFTLTYPQSKMELVSIDDWNSPFDMQTEEITGNGLIKYGRDATDPLTGDQKVATFKFKTTAPVNLSELSVTGDAAIVTPDLKNIISQRPIVRPEEDKSKTEDFFEWLSNIIENYPRLLTQ